MAVLDGIADATEISPQDSPSCVEAWVPLRGAGGWVGSTTTRR